MGRREIVLFVAALAVAGLAWIGGSSLPDGLEWTLENVGWEEP
ncbi:hypothetical protein BH23VER1_BH23VER1_10640 [soil metagenome]